ncbi:cytochrome b6-f complex iron-sulfur subunit, chloroplastic-like [Mangifera indica]|uniref:cytochrome b6-f complex iron-sulfur subunit, chloroplastic-like n=1 Tax=Mangifera indica TaxID=29780 RepID=UPI001CFBB27A|nr:cytochrome b6-f complex iron-sulfur subunit, chloroplastic-like [Mangifera indica]
MASSALSPATPSQLCSRKCGRFSSSRALLGKPTRTHMIRKDRGMKIKCQATSIPANKVPDMGKRQLMNLLLLGAVSLPTGFMLVPYAAFFAPPGLGGAGGGTTAKDAKGNDVIAQGLKGDPTYLVVEKDRTLASFGINAVCTHLGCVVPWNQAEKKFICPCHGSQYNDQGRVVRGPAPLIIAMAHANVEDGKVVFVPWTETDFRTGDAPWWA